MRHTTECMKLLEGQLVQRGTCKVLVGETWEKRHVLRPRRRWKSNIKMDFQSWVRGFDWIYLAQVREKM